MKKTDILFLIYSLGVSVSVMAVAISNSTSVIVIGALLSAFFAYRLFRHQ